MKFNKLFIYFGLVFFLILSTSGSAILNQTEYVNEFSNGNETCNPVDIFSYDRDAFSQTAPVFYNCCNGNECTTVIVDLKGKQLMIDDEYKELIDLNYIKYSLSTGELTKTSFVSNGIDSCYPYGEDELREETVNLIGNTAEEIAAVQKTKKAKQVLKVIKAAKTAELISPFNVVDFGLSIVCNYNNKEINTAVEKLDECNQYLSNIQGSYAKRGYILLLGSCLDTARADFKVYHDNKVAKVKNVVDKVGNTISAGYKFLKNPTTAEFKIEETEYEIAGRIYEEIEPKKLYLHNPDREEIFKKYYLRITQKIQDYNSLKTPLIININNLSKNTPNFVEIIYYYLFFEPNFNISEGNRLINLVGEELNRCDQLFFNVKYNSALGCLQNSTVILNECQLIVERETAIPREFDSRWKVSIIFVIVVIVFSGVLIYILRKKNQEKLPPPFE